MKKQKSRDASLPIPIAERIHSVRLRTGMTRDQLAERVGVSTGAIYMWEKSLRKPRKRLVKVLELILAELEGKPKDTTRKSHSGQLPQDDYSWRDAVIEILKKAGEPKHYTDIAQAIVTEGLRTKVGATPAATVAVTIGQSIQNDGERSPFIKVSPGVYALRPGRGKRIHRGPPGEEEDPTGFINAFGMYWKRDYVFWAATPKLLGQQQLGIQSVDFCGQKGVYLLHDGSKTVYVGRTTDQTLGLRLKQHTIDRLNGRWDRFSWFGIFAVSDGGDLSSSPRDKFNIDNLIATMEALLIEGLEPPQNRRRGDDFSAVEFLQVEDPEIQKTQAYELMEKLKNNLGIQR